MSKWNADFRGLNRLTRIKNLIINKRVNTEKFSPYRETNNEKLSPQSTPRITEHTVLQKIFHREINRIHRERENHNPSVQIFLSNTKYQGLQTRKNL